MNTKTDDCELISIDQARDIIKEANDVQNIISSALRVLGHSTGNFAAEPMTDGIRIIIPFAERRPVHIDLLFMNNRWDHDLYTAIVMQVSQMGGLSKLPDLRQVTTNPAPAKGEDE
jgi:hypothetical protein